MRCQDGIGQDTRRCSEKIQGVSIQYQGVLRSQRKPQHSLAPFALPQAGADADGTCTRQKGLQVFT